MSTIALDKTKKYLLISYLTLGLAFTGVQLAKRYQRSRYWVLDNMVVQKKTRKKSDLKRPKKSFNIKKYIDQAVAEHILPFSDGSQGGGTGVVYNRFLQLLHQHFFNQFSTISDVVTSMRRKRPLMDLDSARNLNLFTGPNRNAQKSYHSILSKKVGISTYAGKYLLLLMLLGANGDKKRIENNLNIFKSLIKKRKYTAGAKALLNDLAEGGEIESSLITFHLRDKYRFFTTEYMKMAIRAERLVPDVMLDGMNQFGVNLRKIIEESDMGVWGIKLLGLHGADLELLMNLNDIFDRMKRWWYTWVYTILDYFKLESMRDFLTNTGGVEDGYEKIRYPYPSLQKGALMWVFNKIYGLIFMPWRLITGKSPLFGAKLSDNTQWWISVPYTGLSLGYFIIKTMLFYPIELINRYLYLPFRNTAQRHKMYHTAANQGLMFLKRIYKMHRIMLTFYKKTRKENPAFFKLCKPYFSRIREVLASRKTKNYRRILKRFHKMSHEPITHMELIKVWVKRPTDIMALVKNLDDLEKREEELLMEGFIALSMLDAFISIARFKHRNRGRLPFVLSTVVPESKKENQSAPILRTESFYSIFLPKSQAVKNDFKNVRNPKTGEDQIVAILGLNGSGKTMAVKGLIENICSAHLGFGFAKKIEFSPVERVVFYANMQDDATQNLSLMMAETKKINSVLRTVDRLKSGEKMHIFMDEPLRGTTSEEATKLLLSCLAYLKASKNNLTVLSTHLSNISKLAKKARFEKHLAFHSPGFDPDTKKGFTYKINKGLLKEPVSLHVLRKMKFHKKVLETTEKLLAADLDYRYSHKIKPYSQGILVRILGSWLLEVLLLLLLFLLIGFTLGSYGPTLFRGSGRGSSIGKSVEQVNATLHRNTKSLWQRIRGKKDD